MVLDCSSSASSHSVFRFASGLCACRISSVSLRRRVKLGALPVVYESAPPRPAKYRHLRSVSSWDALGPRPVTKLGDATAAQARLAYSLTDRTKRHTRTFNNPTDTLTTTSDAFDLSTAVTLAACAFEAYNEPTIVNENFVETTVNGTRTAFQDGDFVAATVHGVLRVDLIGATKLKAADPWGSSDPYAVLTIGDSSRTSRVINRTLQPAWNQTFFLFVRDPMRQRLTIKVNDKDYLSADDPLGSTMRGLADISDGGVHQLDLELVGGGEGRIQLAVQYIALAGNTLSAALSGMCAALPRMSSVPSPWWKLAALWGLQDIEALQPVAYIDNPHSDTQVWVSYNKQLRHIVIAWRGTEQTKWKDILTDVSLSPASFNVERAGGGQMYKPLDAGSASATQTPVDVVAGAVSTLLKKGASDTKAVLKETVRKLAISFAASSVNEPLVHNGFLCAYDTVHMRVLSLIEDILSADGGREGWTVFVTGHSLGGALATLCAYELATRRFKEGLVPPEVIMYNFGSPRVGNKAFAQDYNRSVPNSWRVSNTRDIVATVPRLMGYCHCGKGLQLAADGTLTYMSTMRGVLNTIGDVVIDEGSHLHEILPQLAEKLIEDSNAAQAELMEKLVSKELDLLNTIVDGSGLSEHMEDFYLEALKQLVAARIGDVPAGVLDEIKISPFGKDNMN